MEDHPAIQSGRALLTTAARLDSHPVRYALDEVSQTDFFVDQEARQPDAALAFKGAHLPVPRLFFHCWSCLHAGYLRRRMNW
jgi:hypothetical protein